MKSTAPRAARNVRKPLSRSLRWAALMVSCLPVATLAAPMQTQLFWGDTHVHTSNSTDAYEEGKTNVDLDTAYRFARGFPVIHPATGMKIRIDRPLDFIVIADHSEMLQLYRRLANNDPTVVDTSAGKRLLKIFHDDPQQVFGEVIAISLFGKNQDILEDLHTPAVRQGAWDFQVEAADRHNVPGEFTAFVGWEWSSTPDGLNLHRVVMTPASGEQAKNFLPFSSYDSTRPEELWDWLDKTAADVGVEFMAIPHNSNVSNGLLFDLTDSLGRKITADYARTRLRLEPVVEVTQTKGTSETHPVLSPNDEFAGYEIRDKLLGEGPAKQLPGSYVRTALMRGLGIGAETGVNPYQFGLIGSTDAHTGLSSNDESEFYGKTGADVLPEQRQNTELGAMSSWNVSASGLAAVWATENTRKGIFEAMRRKEVYATTGPRMVLRVFGGFDFQQADADANDIAAVGYDAGVPMGGDLTQAPSGKPVALLIQAAKDPQGANLDRVQVVKGWRDENGELHEKIFDVAWAGEERRVREGKLEPVGNTVDLQKARYTNTIGAPELVTVWKDPEFNAAEQAFYYVRVLEIPTPRHHVYDAVALGLDAEAISDQPATIQERAYSSPIWYTP